MAREALPLASPEVAAYRIPTEEPESDGTLEWDATTLVAVHVSAGGQRGFGYTYAGTATACLVRDTLAGVVSGREALDIARRRADMLAAVRNLGQQGIAAMAISAVDIALWDLKGRILGASLAQLLGCARREIDVYGSGGFTSYGLDRLERQLAGWTAEGIRKVKMKVGRDPSADAARVAAARRAVGDEVELFVDANGAYTRVRALAMAARFAASRVGWFEEPVSSDDLEGLRFVRERAPAGMAIAAGEYGYGPPCFRRMIEARAVDVLQPDATRCGGVSGFMAAAALCEAAGVPLSSHCAPSLHLPLVCAAARAVHLEDFHDHARIESMLFEGAPRPRAGVMRLDAARPGLGIELRGVDAERYRIDGW